MCQRFRHNVRIQISGFQPFSARVPLNRKNKNHAPHIELGRHFMAFHQKSKCNSKANENQKYPLRFLTYQRCQFHQRYMCAFFVQNFGCALVLKLEKKLPKRLLYKKCVRKTLMKLTIGWVPLIKMIIFISFLPLLNVSHSIIQYPCLSRVSMHNMWPAETFNLVKKIMLIWLLSLIKIPFECVKIFQFGFQNI